MRLGGLQKTTLVDYPGKIAATVFTQGCVFRCPYCHNPELVLPEQFAKPLSEDIFFDFLRRRQGQLEGVCITGGEPTIFPDLLDFIKRIKDLGFLVKLDSNGSHPERLAEILQSGQVDYLAMDIKGPAEKYGVISGSRPAIIQAVKESIRRVLDSGIDYEFRTTIARPLLEVADFKGIGELIKGARRYFLQNYIHTKQIKEEEPLEPFTPTQLEEARAMMRLYVDEVGIR